MATYLDDIIAAHRARAEADHRSLAELSDLALAMPPTRGFTAALMESSYRGNADGRAIGVIAEVKRRSPSKGLLADISDPGVLAHSYASGGATCISVLTDAEYFGGSSADLERVRDVVDLPVLRKDFTVSVRDIYDARLMGADAILLIVAALSDPELQAFQMLSNELSFDALVEVHDEQELERALNAGAELVGVNQRDLHTFAVDPERAKRVAGVIPDSVVAVAESGIKSPSDAVALAEAGFRAVLIGESLVTSQDPAGAVRSFATGAHRVGGSV